MTIGTFIHTYKQMKTHNLGHIHVYGSKTDIWNICENLVNYVVLKKESIQVISQKVLSKGTRKNS